MDIFFQMLIRVVRSVSCQRKQADDILHCFVPGLRLIMMIGHGCWIVSADEILGTPGECKLEIEHSQLTENAVISIVEECVVDNSTSLST
jgi:hypothetical protein